MNGPVVVLPTGRVETDCVLQVLADAGLDVADGLGIGRPAAAIVLALPGESTAATLRGVRRDHPLVPLLVVASCLDRELRAALRDCYVAAVVSSSEPGLLLVTAVRAVLEGALPAGAGRGVRSRREDPLAALTERELEVTSLVGEGRTNEQIAAELDISLHTVRTHLAHVMLKVGAPHRHALAVIAQRRGHERVLVAPMRGT